MKKSTKCLIIFLSFAALFVALFLRIWCVPNLRRTQLSVPWLVSLVASTIRPS